MPAPLLNTAGRGDATGTEWVESRFAAKQLALHSPPTKNDPATNVIRAKVEKSQARVFLFSSK